MAQERKKRRIVLASILKPVDDTRMLEKMAVSITENSDDEVFVVGFGEAPSMTPPVNIYFIPLGKFSRISVSRFMARWKALRHFLRIRPDIIIFNTHELITQAILAKVIANATIIYDIRENYLLNIIYGGVFPWLIRYPLALLVRAKEKVLAPAIDHFFLAEACYTHELKFHRAGSTVLENKPVISVTVNPRQNTAGIQLIFTGTLHASTGVFDAIRLAKALHTMDSSVQLLIIGYAPLPGTLQEIQKEIEPCDFITLEGGLSWVPHARIMDAIRQSDFGILSYPDSPHTRNSHPTKLYEYLALGLPIILEKKWPWIEKFVPYDPFILVNFKQTDLATLLDRLRKRQAPLPPIPGVTWLEEAPKLLSVLDKTAKIR